MRTVATSPDTAAAGASPRPRVTIYDDAIFYSATGEADSSVSTGNAFMLFCFAVGRAGGGWLQLGRLRSGEGRIPLPDDARFWPLPDYPSLADPVALARAVPRSLRAMWRAAGAGERVWVMGPHPLGLLLALSAKARRRPVVLGVRQETMEYHRSRGSRSARLAIAKALDIAWKALARRSSVVVVGERIAAEYARAAAVLPIEILLVDDADLAPAPRNAPAGNTVRLLTVGRIDSEKHPTLLVDALAELEHRSPGRYRMRWVGSGPMEDDVRARIAGHAAEGRSVPLELVGFVAPGAALHAEYREADVFVHVSLTEGVPQVLMEAMAHALPIVATDVGGVRSCLRDGSCGLLVPPSSLAPLVEAVERMSGDAHLRERATAAGLEVARSAVLSRQSRRVADFIAAAR